MSRAPLLVGAALVGLHLLLALAAPLLTQYSPVVSDPASALQDPSWAHWAGTDAYGRDVLARVLYGGRYALAVSVAATVAAARMRGERTGSVLVREVLPNVVGVVAVEFALRASWVVLLISSLSFLGFGAAPPTPDWGLMVAENRTAVTVVPWSVLAPILALATLVIGLNLAADGLANRWGVDRMTAGARR